MVRFIDQIVETNLCNICLTCASSFYL